MAHAWVIGVADPTHEIPSDSVFVTGCHVKCRCVSSQFLAVRIPCIKPSSGKLLRQLTTKPATMSAGHWKFLLGLPFGAIIFPDTAGYTKLIRSRSATGCLHGDWYFVCWDAEVLSRLNAAQKTSRSLPVEQPELEAAADSVCRWKESIRNKNWLADAQQLMSDGHRMCENQALVEVLYALAERSADLSEDFMHDHDSGAFANAYEQALDRLECDELVKLPRHLHSEVPKRLQKNLCE